MITEIPIPVIDIGCRYVGSDSYGDGGVNWIVGYSGGSLSIVGATFLSRLKGVSPSANALWY